MRILHVIRSIDPRTGGPGNVVRNVIRQQVRAGHQVTLLATTTQSCPPLEPRDSFKQRMLTDAAFSGAEMYLSRSFGSCRPWSNYAFSPQGGRWLRRRFSNGTPVPDVVHLHGVFGHITTLAAAYARRRSIPYLIEPYGCLDLRMFHGGYYLLKKTFACLFLERDLRHAAWVHPASEHEARDVRRWVAPGRVRVVPHGVDIPGVAAEESREAFLTKHPDLRGRKILLWMARVHPVKRLDLAIESLAKVSDEFPDLVLVVAGQDAGYVSAAKGIAHRLGLSDRVRFVGFLQGELKDGALAAADLFILPSMHENFAISVAEAMAYAVPVIVTPGVAARVHVDASGGGLTVSPDAELLGGAIRTILQSDPKAMGNRGRQYVADNLSWQAVWRQLEMLYDEACSGTRPKATCRSEHLAGPGSSRQLCGRA